MNKQAGAELCQAQFKLKITQSVGKLAGLQIENKFKGSWHLK
jgi:hypothetical protein